MMENDSLLTRYAVVSQHNWKTMKVNNEGRRYTSIGYRAPPSLREAEDWPGTYIVTQGADEPPPRVWGHGTYTEVDGRMTMVASDFDTSG